MELTIADRLFIPLFLPKEGDLRQYLAKEDIRRKVAISKEESEQIGLIEDQETKEIKWDIKKEVPLHIEFTKAELDILKSGCEQIADKKFPEEGIWRCVVKIYDEAQIVVE